MLTYRLPQFFDYLRVNYNYLYNLYIGRLTELFPSSDPGDNNLFIAKEDDTVENKDEFLLELWQKFQYPDDRVLSFS